MCIAEHLESLQYSGIFISNMENWILLLINLLGAKWANCADVWNSNQRSHNLLRRLLHHSLRSAISLNVSSSRFRSTKSATSKLFEITCFANCNFLRLFNPHLFRMQIFKKILVFGFEYWRIQIRKIQYSIICILLVTWPYGLKFQDKCLYNITKDCS